MERKPFSRILKDCPLDIKREYKRLFQMFYYEQHDLDFYESRSLIDICAIRFNSVHFCGRCTSLDDFNEVNNFHFEEYPRDFDVNYLVSFCEYSYNLSKCNENINADQYIDDIGGCFRAYSEQVLKVIDAIGYMPNTKNRITDFVPKDQAVIVASEIVDSDLSYKVIEYNHHSMKGDLDRKKEILFALARKLESKENVLKQINSSLENDLSFLLNSVDIRHNNSEQGSKVYKEIISKMKKEEIEKWYDDTYQMCLLAFIELDNIERKRRVEKLKKEIKGQ